MMYIGPIGASFEIDRRDLDQLEEVKKRLDKATRMLPSGEARAIINFAIGAIDANIAIAKREEEALRKAT